VKGEVFRLLSILFLGAILSGVFVTLRLGGEIDAATQENELLRRQLEESRDEVNQLKRSIGEWEKEVVSSIEPHITIVGENISKLEEKNTLLALDKQVRQWLEPLKGQEVRKLNHLLIPQIIDGRTAEVEGVSYQLKVNLVVVDTNLTVYLVAKKGKMVRPVIRLQTN